MDIAKERKRLIEQFSNTEDVDIIQKVKLLDIMPMEVKLPNQIY